MRVLELIQKTTNETKCPFEGMDFNECQVRQGESVSIFRLKKKIPTVKAYHEPHFPSVRKQAIFL